MSFLSSSRLTLYMVRECRQIHGPPKASFLLYATAPEMSNWSVFGGNHHHRIIILLVGKHIIMFVHCMTLILLRREQQLEERQ